MRAGGIRLHKRSLQCFPVIQEEDLSKTKCLMFTVYRESVGWDLMLFAVSLLLSYIMDAGDRTQCFV